MLILLPPSEGKAPSPPRGAPCRLESLSFPQLTAQRRRVRDALIALSAQPDAARVLGVGYTLAHEVDRNALLEGLPAVPVRALYTGVLFDALDWPTLSASARRRAARRLVVVSALWGALRPADRVPAYRLGMDTDLPGVGALAPAWRPHLEAVLPGAAGSRGLIVDCRSTAYAAAWRPTGDLARRTVAIRAVRERAGRRSVVSHMVKHVRGLVARHLLEHGADPARPDALAQVVGERWGVDLTPPERPDHAWTLTLILRDDHASR